jgi:hypothetical protein
MLENTGKQTYKQQNSQAQNNFNSWTLGLRLDMPLGFRDSNALVRQAQLNLRKQYLYLLDSERKVVEFAADRYRAVPQSYELIKYRKGQRDALQNLVDLDEALLAEGAVKGDEFVTFIFNLAQSRRQLAAANAAYYAAIANYNVSLASLEFAKGTIQRYNNVTVADGPLPGHVAKKAADHFRAREVALKVREQPCDLPLAPLSQWQPTTGLPTALPAPHADGTGLPVGPAARPWEPAQPGAPTPMPLNPESLPPPRAPMPPAGGPAPGGQPNFTPIGTLTLPKRPTPAPEPAPAAGLPPVALPPVPTAPVGTPTPPR